MATPQRRRPTAGGRLRGGSPLGTVIGARSGDKGGNANVGLWARTPAAYAWLRPDSDRRSACASSCPRRPSSRSTATSWPTSWPSISSVRGLLGEGVASSTRPDAQAKSLGEYLRSRLVDVPEALLADLPAADDPR